jgi:hypothetical protein
MGRSLATQLKVVGPAFGIGAILSALASLSGASKMSWGFGDTAEVWAAVLAGPFAGLWFSRDWGPADAVGWAAVCLLAISAHPLRAGGLTGGVSVAGVGLWVLLGFALTYSGV